jgi:hypothetical protein
MRHAIFLDRLKDLKMCRTIFKKRGGFPWALQARQGAVFRALAEGISGSLPDLAELTGWQSVVCPQRLGRDFRVTRGLHGSRQGLRVALPASILALTPSAEKTPALAGAH